nr:uncharacterized protein LOC26530965 [Drosophila virilis]
MPTLPIKENLAGHFSLQIRHIIGYLQAVIYNFVLGNISGIFNQVYTIKYIFLLATFIQYRRPIKKRPEVIASQQRKGKQGEKYKHRRNNFGPFHSREHNGKSASDSAVYSGEEARNGTDSLG